MFRLEVLLPAPTYYLVMLSRGVSKLCNPVVKLADLGIELVDLSLKIDDLCRVRCGLCGERSVERSNLCLKFGVLGSQQVRTTSALLVAARRAIHCSLGPIGSNRVAVHGSASLRVVEEKPEMAAVAESEGTRATVVVCGSSFMEKNAKETSVEGLGGKE